MKRRSKKHLFLWLRNRTTENRKGKKAQNIKGKWQSKNFSTVSKQHVAHLSSPSANCYLRQGKIFRHHNPRKRSFLGIFFCRFCGEDAPRQKKSFEKVAFFCKKLFEKVAFLAKSRLKKCAFLLQPIVFPTTAGLCVLYKVLLLKFGLKMACMCGGILVL